MITTDRLNLFKFLFNRTTPVVRLLELVGLLNSYLLFKKIEGWNLLNGLYLSLLLGYLFIRACDLYAWYPKEATPPGYHPRQVGIRVHFQKALVPTSYILAIVSSLCLLQVPWLSLTVVSIANLFMLVIAPVNGILIWFHWRDKETLPVNYFSLNKYKHIPTV